MPLFVIEQDDAEERPAVPIGATALGQTRGLYWYQATEIDSDGRLPTHEELARANIELPAMRAAKEHARRKIEEEMGDLHEIVADQSKQIEALTVLLCRLTADMLGGTVMSDVTKETYLDRSESVIAALDSGALRLRGDMEGADDMLQRMLQRTNRINQIVEAEYLPLRQSVIG